MIAIYVSTSSYIPPPAFLSLPCLTNSSQMAGPNWLGGVMATMRARLWLRGPPPSLDSSSSCVSFKRFRNALSACFNSCGVGPPPAGGVSAVDMLGSSAQTTAFAATGPQLCYAFFGGWCGLLHRHEDLF